MGGETKAGALRYAGRAWTQVSEPVKKSIGIIFIESGAHLKEASEQAQTRRSLIWFNRVALFIIVPLVMLAHLIPDIREGRQRDAIIDVVICVPLFLFLWAIGIFPTQKNESRRYQKFYRRLTGQEETQVSCEFDENGFLITGSNEVATHHPWKSVIRAMERPLGLVFYTGPKIFHWFPKRVFVAPAHYDALIDLVQAKVSNFERLNAKS